MDFEQFSADTIIILTADDPQSGRIKFSLNSEILAEQIGVKSPVRLKEGIKSCEAQREKIEAACGRAYERQPSTRVTLTDADFEDGA